MPEIVLTECEFVNLDLKRRIKVGHAMWDTGSTATILSRRLVSELQPEGFQQGGIIGIGGETKGSTYLVHIFLPTGDAVTCHEVYEADMEWDAIIGMDIISLGNFHLDCDHGETLFSFELPNDK